MEIKVGQWARVNQEVIGKVIQVETEYPKAVKIKNKEGEFWLINYYQVKTADNLEDLLGVGDVVSLYDTRLKTIYEVVIENELRLHSIVELINEGLYKITAIELYENRVTYRF